MISRTGIHALKALAVLGEVPKGKYLGAAAIARKINAGQNYLGKLLQSLAWETGLVLSRKGLGGGFCLTRSPRRITLREVIGPIDGMERWTGCLLEGGKCSGGSPCSAHESWKKVRKTFIGFLEQTTIADLVEKPELLERRS